MSLQSRLQEFGAFLAGTLEPDPAAAEIYDRLYALYKRLYFGFGHPAAAAVAAADILPALRRVAAEPVDQGRTVS